MSVLQYIATGTATGNKNYALQKPIKTDFLTIIGKAKFRLSFVIRPKVADHAVAQGTRFLHSNIFFYVKLFAIIILS